MTFFFLMFLLVIYVSKIKVHTLLTRLNSFSLRIKNEKVFNIRKIQACMQSHFTSFYKCANAWILKIWYLENTLSSGFTIMMVYDDIHFLKLGYFQNTGFGLWIFVWGYDGIPSKREINYFKSIETKKSKYCRRVRVVLL